jgi:hypothetical protein
VKPQEPGWDKNEKWLTDEGLAKTTDMLATGRFRVDVPEHGALLSVVYLMAAGQAERASQVIAAISPYFSVLRFWPTELKVPAPAPSLHWWTAGEARAALEARLERLKGKFDEFASSDAQRETSLRFFGRLATFLSSTRDGTSSECFVFASNDGATMQRQAEAAAEFVAEHDALAQRFGVTALFGHNNRLHGLIESARIFARACQGGAPDEKAVGVARGMGRFALKRFEKKFGALGSADFDEKFAAALRVKTGNPEAQKDLVQGVSAHIEALRGLNPGEGIKDELATGPRLPHAFSKILKRCVICKDLQEVAVPSADVLSELVSRAAAVAECSVIEDPTGSRLLFALREAFSKRRSLMLFNLEKQVTMDELPWAAPFLEIVAQRAASFSGGQSPLTAVAKSVITATLTHFPFTRVPNMIVRALAAIPGPHHNPPPVYDVAADIFQGAFSDSFAEAAVFAARRLAGTPYERYYGLEQAFAKILQPEFQTADLFLLAQDLAQDNLPLTDYTFVRRSILEHRSNFSVGFNGKIIACCNAMTTCNLIGFVESAGLQGQALSDMASRGWDFVLKILRKEPEGTTVAAPRFRRGVDPEPTIKPRPPRYGRHWGDDGQDDDEGERMSTDGGDQEHADGGGGGGGGAGDEMDWEEAPYYKLPGHLLNRSALFPLQRLVGRAFANVVLFVSLLPEAEQVAMIAKMRATLLSPNLKTKQKARAEAVLNRLASAVETKAPSFAHPGHPLLDWTGPGRLSVTVFDDNAYN